MNVKIKRSLFTITAPTSIDHTKSPQNLHHSMKNRPSKGSALMSQGDNNSKVCIQNQTNAEANKQNDSIEKAGKDSVVGVKTSFAMSCTSQLSSIKEFGSMYLVTKESFKSENEKKVMNVHGVRIRPAVVTFNNTFENQTYSEIVSVQNTSENSVTVRIHSPKAWSFRITPLDRGYLLAPGLKINRRLHYTCTKNGIVNSTLPIYVNENAIELPLEAYKGQASVEIIPTSITFGRVDIACKPVERTILIKNVSFCATKFLVDVGANELDLHVGPMKGWIRPHSNVTIKLQLLALREGIYTSELWIKTDLCQTRIHLEVEACRRNLMVLHPNTISDFTLIDFPRTFYGCRRYQTILVYNMAASSSAFLVLADFGSKGLEPFGEAQKGDQDNVKMFGIEPVEGKIRPFGERIFTFWFNPKIIEKSKKNQTIEDMKDYLCTIRIQRIQVDDFGANSVADGGNRSLKSLVLPFPKKEQSYTNLDFETTKEVLEGHKLMVEPITQDISVLLYLYGEAEVPSMSVVPNSLHFADTLVGNTVVKVVQLTNNSSQPLAFKYSKIPFIKVLPDFKRLAPKTTYDVVVKLCATNIGILKRDLTFNIMAQSNATDKLDPDVLGQVTVKIYGKIKSQKKVPEPKFNPGITPMITHEVGYLTDHVTFTSKVKKPRCAMTALAQGGRPWYLPDTTIAFPNDRPLTLRPRPTDATAKTIYKGLARYVAPVDESMTYTAEELVRKKAHDNWFLQYVRGTAALSVSRDRCCKWKTSKIDPDPPLVLQDKEPNLPREVLIPLTFVQLYRIKVFPALISFGNVTTGKSCSQLVSIENGNDFKICARIMPLTSGITIQTLENFIISENSETKVMLILQRETLGRYSGTITCVINAFHSFDIAVVAEVVHRSLSVTPEHMEIKIPDTPFANMFVPLAVNNPLNIPITFYWDIPDESPIKIEPIVGVTPEQGTVWCGAYFEPENPNYKLYPIKLMVEGTTCLKLKTGIILPKTNVHFLESAMNIGYIPMNITTVKRIIFFNPDFSDAMFVVLNKEPVQGVKVKPSSGTIRPRSCSTLTLHINISHEKSLDFTVYMTLQNSASIEIKITGTVVYPQVEITPQYINLHRVPCNSVVRTTLQAENKTKAIAEVRFNMEEYPQFKVSLSKRVHDPGLNSHGFTLDPEATKKFYLYFIPKNLASYDFYLPVIINNLLTRRNSTLKEMEAQDRMIKCAYKKTSITEKKRLNSVIIKRGVMSHLVLIDVVVLKASMVVSESELSFSSTDESKSFTIKNTSELPIIVFFHCEDCQAPFEFEADAEEAVFDKGSLKISVAPGGLVKYTVNFTATRPGSYLADVSILTICEDHCCVFTTVRLTGVIAFPCVITSTVNEIYLQPVPLNVETSFLFHLKITHNKQRETSISYDIMDPNVDMFNVEYLQGNKVVGITKVKIPVKITFRSSTPTSLRKQITFKGGKNAECTITVIATADNCLVTTHAFLKNHSPYKQRLKISDQTAEKLALEHEKIIPPKLHPIQNLLLKNNSSSGSSSGMSQFSSDTSSVQSSGIHHKKKLSVLYSTHSVRKILTNSDMELSCQLGKKEEKSPSMQESFVMTEIITKEDEEIIFPMFPQESAASENAIYMNKTLHSVQKWVYEQVFCCSYNPSFGSHAFSSFTLPSKKDYGQNSPVAMKNVFDALERICGRRIRRFFTPIDKLPEDPIAKAVFTYNLYQQLVDFMVAQGALMAHVEPKYLMVYDEYCSYHKTILKLSTKESEQESPDNQLKSSKSNDSEFSDDFTSPQLMSHEKFLRISIQCWLDLFLQMFKTLILGPSIGISYTSNEFLRRTIQIVHNQDFDVKSLYGRAEEQLLTWLTHQYNTQRTLLWPNESLPPRTVSNFDQDLEDGLVLTAATAAYCPYLNEIHFNNMFLNPITISQAYHNATCLCMAWDSIRLGFSASPRDFVQPNTINMLLLVTHLYKVLPSYKPEATITFKAILNVSDSQILILENNEEATITYHVEILPRNTNFSLEDCENSFVLKRKSKSQITVQYLARSANKAEAILLLCGACMPPKFGRNYVFKLEGYPIKLPVCSSFNLISPQNTLVNTQITIESPHQLNFKAEESYSYDLWIAYIEPQPENLNALRWAKERRRKIPRWLFFPTNTLTVSPLKTKMGCGELSLKLCCFSQIKRDYWLIFRNKVIGDFIVKLQVTPHKPDPVMNLLVTLTSDLKCTCTPDQSSGCMITTVDVPCRNLELWAAVKTMFELTISPSEKQFWATYMESNIGFRLLKWMMEGNKVKVDEELEIILEKSRDYKVSCPSKYISCVTPLQHIPDVRSKSSLPVQLHFDANTPNLSTVLNLTSTDGFEMRSYNLTVVNNKK